MQTALTANERSAMADRILTQSVTASGEESVQPEVTRVLIADENPTVRKILKHVFTSLDWETVEAANGEQALEEARKSPSPHAVLLDLKLPVIDGYEVCRTLKADIQNTMIPVIALTTVESSEEKMRAVEAGVDEFLSKPVNHAELQVRLRSLMRMHRFNRELIGAESVAMALARAVASKDGYSSSHVEQVANFAVVLGERLGLDRAQLNIIKYGAILHNVGKISIPDAVLEKTTALSPREKALFQQHPRLGCDICAPLKPLEPILPIIRHHKEHWDGTGFPDGLRGDDIPLSAQIVGVVDVYSALTNDRPYRKAVSHAEAIADLEQRARQGWHNPDLIREFVACFDGEDHPAEDADVGPQEHSP